jgi:RNA polymerase sigma-70 factor, ECF subfamily
MTSDADCMGRVAAGDLEAVGVIYDKYSSILFPIVLRIVRNAADAEDVLHDAFVTLPVRARHYAPERGSVVAWLVILVRNLSIDRVRRHGRGRELVERDAREAVAPDIAGPEETTDLARTCRQLRHALASLNAIHRTTLELAFFEGLTYAEIAEREGISLGTVKSRANRAMSVLRDAIERSSHT